MKTILSPKCTPYAVASLLSALLVISACGGEDGASAPHADTVSYLYTGFVLSVNGQEVIRCENGITTGRIFINPKQVIPPVGFAFLDASGARVAEPGDSVVVVLNPDNYDRVTIRQPALPNEDFGWGFYITALKVGVTNVRVEFLPDGVCRTAEFVIQVVG